MRLKIFGKLGTSKTTSTHTHTHTGKNLQRTEWTIDLEVSGFAQAGAAQAQHKLWRRH